MPWLASRPRPRYRQSDGSEQTLEAGFTRYSVILTGEKLPDGRKADGVYIMLNEIFIQVINGAMTRPLDYDYLKSLPPAPQRFYELFSYQMYAALKYDRPRAKLNYSEFCAHAPQTRHVEWERVRSQMNKVHRPHLQSGYIAKVDFQQTTDSDGKPDWIMLYMPGPKARAEFRAFTKRGGPTVLEIEPLLLEPLPQLCGHEPPPLEAELIERGITAAIATELVREHAEEKIRAQMERLDWLMEKKPGKDRRSGRLPGSGHQERLRRPQRFRLRKPSGSGGRKPGRPRNARPPRNAAANRSRTPARKPNGGPLTPIGNR